MRYVISTRVSRGTGRLAELSVVFIPGLNYQVPSRMKRMKPRLGVDMSGRRAVIFVLGQNHGVYGRVSVRPRGRGRT